MINNNEEIESINVQLAFTSALLFAISLNLYASFGYKDILINGQNSKFTRLKLYKIGLLSASITLIVTIYFLITTYDTYKSDNTRASYNFYMATVLSYTAQSIRLTTLIKYPESVVGVEDII